MELEGQGDGCKDDISHLSEEVTSFKTRPLTSDQHPSTYRRGRDASVGTDMYITVETSVTSYSSQQTHHA
jgi:hypothetical protein